MQKTCIGDSYGLYARQKSLRYKRQSAYTATPNNVNARLILVPKAMLYLLFGLIYFLLKNVYMKLRKICQLSKFMRYSLLTFIILILFSFIAAAQEPLQNGGANGQEGGAEDYRHDGTKSITMTYEFHPYPQALLDSHLNHFDIRLQHYPLIIYGFDYAQTANVRIGEKLPDFLKAIAFQYVDKEGQTQRASLADYDDKKLLVLDFWATWCAPCIRSMHKWDTIYRALDADVQVLGIMLDHNYHAQYFGLDKGWSIPIVFGPECLLLNSFFFDRKVVSRMAWIQAGKLLAITGTAGYDLATVQQLLLGKPVTIPIAYEWTYSLPNS